MVQMTDDPLQHPAQARMVGLLQALAVDEGYTLTAVPGVRLLRSNRPLARTPVLYDLGHRDRLPRREARVSGRAGLPV